MKNQTSVLNRFAEEFEEILTKEDLEKLLASGKKLRHYIGFEISGLLHVGQGLLAMEKVAFLQEIGAECIIFLADWHTWINKKLKGAELPVVTKIALEYLKPALSVGLKCAGGNPQKVRFILGSEFYHHNDEYWKLVLRIAKETTLARVVRSIEIAGRQMEEHIDFAILIYPIMQAADIFSLKVNLPHGGTDQRKIHVIARKVAPKLGYPKPVALHNYLILGLNKPSIWPIPPQKAKEARLAMKMSKSKPDTCVFLHDTPEEIERKIQKAFCPPDNVEFNPIIDWTKHLVLPIRGEIKIVRRGGKLTITEPGELEDRYLAGDIHPADLKQAVAEALIEILTPAREFFQKGEGRKSLKFVKQLIGK